MALGNRDQIGTVEHVLEMPSEDLFDGLAITTPDGLRFVDRDQIAEITDTVRGHLAERGRGGRPAGTGRRGVLHVDPLEDSGNSMHDRFGRMFDRPHWRTD